MEEEETCPEWFNSVNQERCARFCQGCLSSDRHLSALGENQDLFICLLSRDYSIDLTTVMLCWKCQEVLRETRKIQQQIQMIHDIMQDLVSLSALKMSYLCPDDTEMVLVDISDKEKNGQNKNKQTSTSLKQQLVFEDDEEDIKEVDINIDIKLENENESIDKEQSAVNSLSGIEHVSGENIETEPCVLQRNRMSNTDVLANIGNSPANEEIKVQCIVDDGTLHKNCKPPEDKKEGKCAERVKVTDEEKQELTREGHVQIKHQAIIRKPEFQYHSNSSDKDRNKITANNFDEASSNYNWVGCDSCSFMTSDKNKLIKHLKSHETCFARKLFTCDICNNIYEKKKSLCDHLKTHCSFETRQTCKSPTYTDKKGYKCKVCNKVFTASQNLTKHLIIHSENKSFKCEICEKMFTRLYSFKSHSLIHTATKLHKCVECNKGFRQIGHLNRHSRTHTGEKLYMCEICSKQFTSRFSLTTHHRIHSREEPYKCEICDKKFRQAYSLRRHSRIHSGDKRYNCKECDKSFVQKCNLETHLRTHSGEKLHNCKLCNKRFSRLDSLRLHFRTHTGNKPYECEICEKRFSRVDSFQLHLLKHKT